MATILIVGATGKTGLPLVEQILSKNHKVRLVVRSSHKLSSKVLEHPNTILKEAAVLDLTDKEMAEQVKDCDAVVSCLGHTGDFKGLFGEPKKLCTEATRRLCNAIEWNNPSSPIKFILMNTVLVRNPDCDEKRKWYDRTFLFLLRHIIPAHRDNETAVEHLHLNVGNSNTCIDWCVVRPELLINAEVSSYEIREAPTTGIFTLCPTARSNVAHFMIELIDNCELWNTWKFKMPVMMNS